MNDDVNDNDFDDTDFADVDAAHFVAVIPTAAEIAYAAGYDAHIAADKLAGALGAAAPRVPDPRLFSDHMTQWGSFAAGWRQARAFLIRERIEQEARS
jgi:hypothetical protein